MPLYVWKDKNTGIEVEVRHSISKSEDPPSLEECLDEGALTEEEFKEADWVKLINTGTSYLRGKNFRGRKGCW